MVFNGYVIWTIQDLEVGPKNKALTGFSTKMCQ